MYAVHHFYEVLKAREVQNTLATMQSSINSMCDKIPPSLVPPWQAMQSCTVQLYHNRWKQVGVANYSTPFTVTAQLPKVSNPKSLYELMPWEHFTTTTKHEITGLSPEHGLYSSFQSEISGLVSLIEHHMNTAQGSLVELRPVEVLQGYTRFSEEVGREYIMDVMFREAENRNNVQTKRIRLVRPLSQDMTMVTEEATTSSTVINVVLPLYQADASFLHFMEWYSTAAVENTHLILCVIGDTTTLYSAQTAVANYTGNNPGARATVLSGTDDLSPLGALKLGVSTLSGRDLVFIADTALRLRSIFFETCRKNTIEGKKVYYPIPYVMFSEPHEYPGPGHWGYYSLSSLCIYKSDFVMFSDSPKHLFQHISQSNLELFQAPDPGLIRVSVAETCEGLTGDVELKAYCRDLLESAQFDGSAVEYMYEHNMAVSHTRSLSFVELEESL